jgi:hypothetical protein
MREMKLSISYYLYSTQGTEAPRTACDPFDQRHCNSRNLQARPTSSYFWGKCSYPSAIACSLQMELKIHGRHDHKSNGQLLFTRFYHQNSIHQHLRENCWWRQVIWPFGRFRWLYIIHHMRGVFSYVQGSLAPFLRIAQTSHERGVLQRASFPCAFFILPPRGFSLFTRFPCSFLLKIKKKRLRVVLEELQQKSALSVVSCRGHLRRSFVRDFFYFPRSSLGVVKNWSGKKTGKKSELRNSVLLTSQ